MLLPDPRGELSTIVVSAIRSPQTTIDLARLPRTTEPLSDADFQFSLWLLYELHYRSFDDAPDDAEWAPDLLSVRRELERAFDAAVEEVCADHVAAFSSLDPADVPDRLFELVETFPGPSLAEYVQRRADREQVREMLLHRSVYHLKEADPHSFVIPRLTGAAKAGLVELQYDEYGNGEADRVHQELFARALRAAGLDPAYGAYVDVVPAEVLAISNVMSLYGLHRHRRGPQWDIWRRSRQAVPSRAGATRPVSAGSGSETRWPDTSTSTSRPTRFTSSSPFAGSARRCSQSTLVCNATSLSGPRPV